eukprot:g13402.t1
MPFLQDFFHQSAETFLESAHIKDLFVELGIEVSWTNHGTRHPNLPPRKDEQIQNLERSVLNLVNQGASPGMVAFVEELRQLVDGKMKKELLRLFWSSTVLCVRELRNQQNTTQSTLNAHFGAIAHCAQQDWREVLDVALGQDVKANASSVESFGLQPLAQKHRLCRWGEWQRWEEKTSTQAAMEKSKE